MTKIIFISTSGDIALAVRDYILRKYGEGTKIIIVSFDENGEVKMSALKKAGKGVIMVLRGVLGEKELNALNKQKLIITELVLDQTSGIPRYEFVHKLY